MPADLRQRRVYRVDISQLGMRVVLVAGAYDKHFFRPQVYGGADGSQLAHGAIPAPLGFVTERNSLRRKYEWDGTGRHKMLDAYGAGHGATQGAAPGLDGAVRLVEREMLAAGIAGCRDGERLKLAARDVSAQDGKGGVSGKSVAVGVSLGGG